jgi:hypothetical protein
MKLCIACGTELAEAAKFCVRCGIDQQSANLIGGGKGQASKTDAFGSDQLPLFKGRKNSTDSTDAISNEAKLRTTEIQRPSEPKPPREPLSKKTKITIASALAGIVTLIGVVVANTAPVSLGQALNTEQLTLFAKESCSSLEIALKAPMSFETYNSRLSGLQKQRLARPAKRFVDKYTWTATSFAPAYESEVATGISEIVEKKSLTLGISADRIDLTQWALDFTPIIMEQCTAQSDYDDTLSALTTLDTETSRVVALAATAPWYPVGFEEVSTHEGFAYQNRTGGSCAYYAESCASFTLISNKSCPTLYVEVGMETSSNYEVDYSNDIKYGVAPGEKLRFVMNSWYYDFDHWRIKDISCY